jgi:hypothetical protein
MKGMKDADKLSHRRFPMSLSFYLFGNRGTTSRNRLGFNLWNNKFPGPFLVVPEVYSLFPYVCWKPRQVKDGSQLLVCGFQRFLDVQLSSSISNPKVTC